MTRPITSTRGAALIAAALCSTRCDDVPAQTFELEHIIVETDFADDVCAGTFPWLEQRLRWLETATGVPASTTPILFHWKKYGDFDFCETGFCVDGTEIHGSLLLLSHELVHAHLGQLGHARPWLSEGLADLLADQRWSNDYPQTPSEMMAIDRPIDVDYTSAAQFVDYLRSRFGMPAVIDLYARSDGMSADEMRREFERVFAVDFATVEAEYLAQFVPEVVGSLDCARDHLEPEAGRWSRDLAPRCADDGVMGPYHYFSPSEPVRLRYHLSFSVPVAGTYRLELRSTAKLTVNLAACDVDDFHSWWAPAVDEPVELMPSSYRLEIIADRGLTEPIAFRLTPA